MTLATALTALLAAALFAAVVGLRSRNTAAMPLLASTIYSSALCWLGVEFRPSLWLAIDLSVIMWIVILWAEAVGSGGYGKRRDVAILALYAPIWLLYFAPWGWRSEAVQFLVSIQLLLTFPWRRAWRRIGPLIERLRRSDTGTLDLAWARKATT